jgi:two-component system nitrate/nitrite response regulator NarL
VPASRAHSPDQHRDFARYFATEAFVKKVAFQDPLGRRLEISVQPGNQNFPVLMLYRVGGIRNIPELDGFGIIRGPRTIKITMASAKKEKIKVLIADDHPVVRKGLQSCLSKQDRLKVVGEASDGDEALLRIRETAPHVVLLDISMPRMDGLTVTQQLRKELPDIKVLILSAHNTREYIFRIIQSGAHGYVSKEAKPEELMRAIESVYQGEPFFSPEIARAALNQLVNSGGKKEVLVLVAEGQSNKEIASKLGIGVRTIETHRERIMRRLDIHSVAGLTKFAIANGMVSIEGTSIN